MKRLKEMVEMVDRSPSAALVELEEVEPISADQPSVGFTLVELLVAMTVVAVLAGLALVSYQGARKTARDGKRKADLEQVRNALEMYWADSGTYPVGSLSSGAAIGSYMTIPADPLPGQVYSYIGSADSYVLCAALEVGGIGTGCGYAVGPGGETTVPVACVCEAAVPTSTPGPTSTPTSTPVPTSTPTPTPTPSPTPTPTPGPPSEPPEQDTCSEVPGHVCADEWQCTALLGGSGCDTDYTCEPPFNCCCLLP